MKRTTPVFTTTLSDISPGFTVRIDSDQWNCFLGLPLIVTRGYRLVISVTDNGLVSAVFQALEEGV